MQQEDIDVTHEQYLTFVIDDEEYAVGILRVKEIIAYDALTRVPRTAPFIRGMINLRGSVVPVIDLAQKFGFRAAPIARSTCVVIVEVVIENEPAIVGLLVDAVSQVVELAPEEIEPPPQFGTLGADFLVGMARSRSGRKFVLLLDIDRVLAATDFSQVAEALAAAGEPAAEAQVESPVPAAEPQLPAEAASEAP